MRTRWPNPREKEAGQLPVSVTMRPLLLVRNTTDVSVEGLPMTVVPVLLHLCTAIVFLNHALAYPLCRQA